MSALCPECGKPVTSDGLEGLCPECMLKVGLGTEPGPGGQQQGRPGHGVDKALTPPVSEVARLLPQLEVVECLGRGGMGVVYKARQPKLDRWVALKILAREREESPGFADRFAGEARALARLNHSHIVAVYDFGQIDQFYYLVMEFVDGLSLRQLLQARRLTPAEALAIVPPVCEALQYAHQQGIVHRDIKPENILLDKQGRVKVADFGIAKIVGADQKGKGLTGDSQVLGTPHYMAPEQVERPATVDHRADIYSLGVVLYEMLTGELPLGRFPPPSQKPQVDARLDQVVLRALEKAPERRYQQASEVQTDVETITRSPPSPPPPLAPVPPSETAPTVGGPPGVRPSPGAGTSGARGAVAHSSAPAPSVAAAPEDGRTPGAVSGRALALAATAIVLALGSSALLLRSHRVRDRAQPASPASVSARPLPPGAIDLLQRYPTSLTVGDSDPDRARAVEFAQADLFSVSRFQFPVGDQLRLELGPADLGVGHCPDGALWALLIARKGGTLVSPASTGKEPVARVWLRFHPKEINRLFPPETVSVGGSTNLVYEMRIVAKLKTSASYHSFGYCLIPDRKSATVDIDTTGGPRRFFVVDFEAGTVAYVPNFEALRLRPPPAVAPMLVASAFEGLCNRVEQSYPIATLRPEVDWAGLYAGYRPRALAATSTYELAGICAEMLSQLHNPQVRLQVAGAEVPVFSRQAAPNGSRSAYGPLLGKPSGRGLVEWTVTGDSIGFLAVHGWLDSAAEDCNLALERMRQTRGLVLDVRWNTGGNEGLAREASGQFLSVPFLYALGRVRIARYPSYLSSELQRTASPRGPWRYDRPVLLLIGPRCMDASESFIAMMMGAPNVTTMGAATRGAPYGASVTIELPLEMTAILPSEIEYLPGGACINGRGIQPQIEFKPAPGAFGGGRDDLLAAALERLRKLPLPESPIGGPAPPAEQAGQPAAESTNK